MKDDEADIEKIEAYLRGTLVGEDLEVFQRRRREDPEFDREVTDYVQIMGGIRTSGERNFMSQLKQWDGEIRQREGVKVIPIRMIMSVAASVLLLAMFGVYLFRNHKPDHEQLFRDSFAPYEDVISERSAKNDSEQRGMEMYNQKNYAEAIIQLKLAALVDPRNPALRCYLGIAYLAGGHADEAQPIFEEIVRGDHSLFKEVAEWNLAMTYLKLNQEALLKKTLLTIIGQKDHLFRAQAEELQAKL
jgi:tetratricopeptide (TPR) repeat protein